MLPYNKELKQFSQKLRKNMTDAERRLWSRIRGKQLNGHQFYRQKPIGEYIVDFYCAEAKLVIELDGGQHYSEEGMEMDKIRDGYLQGLGLQVLRFSNRDVLAQTDSVLEKIMSCIPL
ncbi:MAG: endonuclease domain-containing protein [Nitrospiraceae bacterium]|nr:endonuclease domain-containing protein [Nitrospiraceae bacterium]